jgi:hypothetical protein
VTFFVPQGDGVLNVTVKSPRVLSREVIVKLADPPEVTVLEAGEIARLVATLEAEIVPE